MPISKKAMKAVLVLNRLSPRITAAYGVYYTDLHYDPLDQLPAHNRWIDAAKAILRASIDSGEVYQYGGRTPINFPLKSSASIRVGGSPLP